MPPNLAPATVDDRPQITREQWMAGLTRAQRTYVTDRCSGGEGDAATWSQLCGACPLVVAWDGQRVTFEQGGGRFPFAAGDAEPTDWPSADTPWLALDRDGDGAITSGAELFGNGRGAANGVAALAALDANGDGRLDANDPAFARLVLWSDRDGDRRGAADELVAAASVIDAIELRISDAPRCDARGNCERERAAIAWHDARGGRHVGAVVDVYLRYR